MTTLPVRLDGWSVDDLDGLPDDDGLRYELVDGSLVVTPPPRPWHDDLAAQLLLVLAQALPPEWRVGLAPGICFDARNYRQPDVAVYRREAVAKDRFEAGDVLLVVEVMSPGSISSDRVTKPAQYAAAGIRHYWRVERDPLVLVVHALDGGVYREAGQYSRQVQLSQPVPVEFALPDLLP